jgi:hypothetical protein
MDFNRRQITKGLAGGLATSTALTQLPRAAFADKKLRIAMVVKVLGINYFDVGRDGGQEAAKELGDIELIYAGPTAATVEQQIAVIDTLIAQHVHVLPISATFPEQIRSWSLGARYGRPRESRNGCRRRGSGPSPPFPERASASRPLARDRCRAPFRPGARFGICTTSPQIMRDSLPDSHRESPDSLPDRVRSTLTAGPTFDRPRGACRLGSTAYCQS